LNKRGRPPTFKDGDEIISLWLDFCYSIIDNDYSQIPTQAAFCRWLGEHYEKTSVRTLYNALNKYFPTIKKEFIQIQSDVIMQGGMLGKYNPTMAIFGLKNWCGWNNDGRNVGGDEAVEIDPLTQALQDEADRINENRTETTLTAF